MGELVEFPTPKKKVSPGGVVPCEDGVVLIHTDGSVQYQGDVDVASRAVWSAVAEHVKAAWEASEVPRLRRQIKLLKALLDEYAPEWRTDIRRRRGD